jgi:hypothetical protein
MDYVRIENPGRRVEFYLDTVKHADLLHTITGSILATVGFEAHPENSHRFVKSTNVNAYIYTMVFSYTPYQERVFDNHDTMILCQMSGYPFEGEEAILDLLLAAGIKVYLLYDFFIPQHSATRDMVTAKLTKRGWAKTGTATYLMQTLERDRAYSLELTITPPCTYKNTTLEGFAITIRETYYNDEFEPLLRKLKHTLALRLIDGSEEEDLVKRYDSNAHIAERMGLVGEDTKTRPAYTAEFFGLEPGDPLILKVYSLSWDSDLRDEPNHHKNELVIGAIEIYSERHHIATDKVLALFQKHNIPDTIRRYYRELHKVGIWGACDFAEQILEDHNG